MKLKELFAVFGEYEKHHCVIDNEWIDYVNLDECLERDVERINFAPTEWGEYWGEFAIITLKK